MKTLTVTLAAALLLFGYCPLTAQEDVTIVAPTSEAAKGLDLKAVSELFKEAKDLEEFEKALNDPETGVNNLDLDGNGEVDYIRVVEQAADDARLIILQVPLGKDEFQDVATIEVEKTGNEAYSMQVRGNEVIYGPDYYVAPVSVHIHTWPLITWMYAPYHRPYRSRFYFGFYPPWWRPYRPVTVSVYRTRTVRFTTRTTFTVTRTSRVQTVTKVNYKPRNSTRVRKTTVTRTGRTTTTKTTVKRTNTNTGKTTRVGVKKTTKAVGVSRTNENTGKTTKVGVKKTTNKNTGRTTVTAGKKKTKRTKSGSTTVTKTKKKRRRK